MTRYILLATALAMAKTIAAQSTLTTSAPAATTTYVSLFVGGDTSSVLQLTSVAGSIVNANALATTIAINCIDGNSECDMISGAMTAVQGPSTRSGHVVAQSTIEGVAATVTLDSNCKITGSTQAASCAETVAVVEAYDGSTASTATSTTVSVASTDISYQKLLITAGLDKLNQPQATQTPGAAPAIAATGNMGVAVGGAVAGAVVALAGLL